MKRGAKKNQGSKHVHILRALRAGDVIYVPSQHPRTAELLRVAAREHGGDCETDAFLATASKPETAHTIIRITMLKRLSQ